MAWAVDLTAKTIIMFSFTWSLRIKTKICFEHFLIAIPIKLLCDWVIFDFEVLKTKLHRSAEAWREKHK